ncbi:response regulator [Noviherbaspirillum sp. L7-7A]|uniref:response regulator transcription factor n=1 Tax=Noviherbaspirillum sp. L7-7A TaxID=2850560 RepID=UPI001C2BA7DD|nr:response regulator [Noviherbaspirillum sp. L7-7A]MBV0882003.1 response regulator [Noviherbaspirillum sp. L7-7A]
MPCKHIVVIEDDTDLRETLKDLLEMEGFSVVTASNGREGLRQIEQNGQPCLILLDLMMPVMNGWEFLEALRREKAAPLAQTPVAVVSAAADIADVERDYNCSVLKKPVSLERLFALAHAHCENC